MVALLNSTEKDLNKADKIYRDIISKSISTDYHENLKQYGITLLVENGLIENGNIKQKEFYIKEQVSSTSNMPHIGTFYSLINAKNLTFSKEDLSKLEMEFYTKNLAFINSIDWSSDKEGKKEKVNLLNFNHKMFVRYQSTL